ncbi:alkaline phosphatase family protein, partial [Vibrio parahaemolyticus]|nr:alkaline phosphatase family protein [Vibrio parahaemolyticus]
PILRKVTATEINIWLVTTQRLEGMVQITDENASILYQAPLSEQKEQLQIGLNAWCCLLKLEGEFPTHQALRYQIKTQYGLVTELLPHLTYERDNTPNLGIEFLVSEKADYLLHGSCRNPHHFSDDTLVAADHKIASQSIEERPDMLIMSGDQIYADHVAGPTLDAIEQVIALLGLPGEEFDQAPIKNTNDLYQHPACYYGRDKLLPHYVSDDSLLSK